MSAIAERLNRKLEAFRAKASDEFRQVPPDEFRPERSPSQNEFRQLPSAKEPSATDSAKRALGTPTASEPSTDELRNRAEGLRMTERALSSPLSPCPKCGTLRYGKGPHAPRWRLIGGEPRLVDCSGGAL